MSFVAYRRDPADTEFVVLCSFLDDTPIECQDDADAVRVFTTQKLKQCWSLLPSSEPDVVILQDTIGGEFIWKYHFFATEDLSSARRES